jgi:hypothetical protein
VTGWNTKKIWKKMEKLVLQEKEEDTDLFCGKTIGVRCFHYLYNYQKRVVHLYFFKLKEEKELVKAAHEMATVFLSQCVDFLVQSADKEEL